MPPDQGRRRAREQDPDTELLLRLKAILSHHPGQAAPVRAARTPAAAAEALARLGALNGVPTSAAELRGWVARLTVSTQPGCAGLDDSDLEAVVGGAGSPGWQSALLTLLGLGRPG